MEQLIKNRKIVEQTVKTLLFLLLTYFVLFNHLGRQSIRLWDESRVALNAYEMYQNGYSVVTTFNGEPDMWNVKPSLLAWFQVTSMKAFGVSEFSLRLPSAIFGFLTCCLLMFLSIKYLESYWLGLFAVLILLSSRGFVDLHRVRNAEYESTLVFFTTLYALCFFLYTELKEEKNKRLFLNLAFLGLTLAVLTKGIAGLLITPGILIYIIYKKQLRQTLLRRQTYINIVLFLAGVLGFYFLREYHNEGYVATVWYEEIAGRYKGVTEANSSSFNYYFKRFFELNFNNWYPFLIGGTIVVFLWKNSRFRNLVIYCLLVSLVFLFVITGSGTHYGWYDMPIYPLLSLVTAFALYWMLEALLEYEAKWSKFPTKILAYGLVLAFCIPSYNQILNEETSFSERNDEPFYDVSYYLKEALDGQRDLNGYLFVYEGYFPHNLFYINQLRDYKNVDIQVVRKADTLEKGDKIIIYQETIKEDINNYYEYDIIEEYKSARVLLITGRKKE